MPSSKKPAVSAAQKPVADQTVESGRDGSNL